MDKWKRWMANRYGFDFLSCALLCLSVLLNMIALILTPVKSLSVFCTILGLLSYVPLLLCFLRCLSTNRSARMRENSAFLRRVGPLLSRSGVGMTRQERKQRKLFKYFKCPQCKQKVRVPRGKGKIEITCPSCSHKFIKRT